MDARTLTELADKEAIRTLLNLRCRASDRCDMDLALDCYHEDGIEVHPGYETMTARAFIINHSEMARGDASPVYMMSHVLLNMIIDLDGDAAFVETYHVARNRARDASGDREYTIGGRYLDMVTKRDGRWAISRREIVVDWSTVLPVGEQFWDVIPNGSSIIRGERGASDALYQHIQRGAVR